MARKRMIDPSIWSDDGMAQLTPRQQLLYIGLISNADDTGRLKGSTVAIRLMCPTVYYGESDDTEIENDLRTILEVMGKIRRYVVDGKPYLEFRNYRTWQRIDKPQPSKLPEPSAGADSDNDLRMITELSENDSITTPPNRIEVKRSKEKGMEEVRSATAPPPPAVPLSIQRANGRASPTEQPIEYVIALSEEMGQPFDEISPSFKGQQCKFAKDLSEQGHSVDQVRRCIRWMRTDAWHLSKGIDLNSVKRYIGKFELNGEPVSTDPKTVPVRSRLDNIPDWTHGEPKH